MAGLRTSLWGYQGTHMAAKTSTATMAAITMVRCVARRFLPEEVGMPFGECLGGVIRYLGKQEGQERSARRAVVRVAECLQTVWTARQECL